MTTKRGTKPSLNHPDVPKETRLRDLQELYERCREDIEKNGLSLKCKNGAFTRNPAISAMLGTDLQNRATFDREEGATRAVPVRFLTIGAYRHAARHAVKCAECGRPEVMA